MNIVWWIVKDMGGCNNGATIRKVVMEVKLMVFSLVETKH